MDEKKPRKKIHSDFSGMKKEVKRGPTKKKKKVWTILEVHEGKAWNVRVSKKDNDKVHASSRWRNSGRVEKRTARRRVKEIDEIKELAIMHPLRIKQRKRDRSAIVSKNKYIIVQPTEREFDFMR
jgi:hypothetical protein